jgi:hypothetical protein
MRNKLTSEKLETLKAQLRELKLQFMTESQRLFSEAATELFDKYPTIESFSWTQYTPYFNDGDECTFRVNEYEPDITLVDGTELVGYDLPDDATDVHAASSEIEDFVGSIDTDVMRDAYGDHARVRVHRDGTTDIEEYSHD